MNGKEKTTGSEPVAMEIGTLSGRVSASKYNRNEHENQAEKFNVDEIVQAGLVTLQEPDPDAMPDLPESARPGPVFVPLSLTDLLKLPPKDWLLEQVFGAGDLVMLYGPPGTGKTFVAIDMIFALCLGQRWGERFDVTRPLSVAYCAGEGTGGLPQRFAAAAEFYSVEELHNSTPKQQRQKLFTSLLMTGNPVLVTRLTFW
jgi:hypothetical protein